MLKTKYLLPLILILFLTFILIGYSADLYGTYDQRIKFTIDSSKIDAQLTWIPITTFFTATQAEEIFAEFDSDDDFDRGAFTKADGSTQLFADCELFDDSESKGLYHVSRDGWVIANGADTDYYFYYDKDAAHNTTYISMSGDTAAQSVWDSDFKAVYHKHDVVVDYDTQYEATVEPDSDGWTLEGTDYSSVSAGILTIDTSADDTYQCRYYKSPNVDFDAGFYLKTRIKASTDMNAGDDKITIKIQDGTQNESFTFTVRNGSIEYSDNTGSLNSVALDTTTSYVVYEIYIKGTATYLYADGVQKATNLVYGESVSDVVNLGDYDAGKMCKVEIDYVYYALGVADNPLPTIIDSTSNSNDGTKKDTNEPIEAAGKVGLAQDFDGTNDYIIAPDVWDAPTEISVEMIGKADDTVAEYRALSFDIDEYAYFRFNSGATANLLRANVGGSASSYSGTHTLTNYNYMALTAKANQADTGFNVYVNDSLVHTVTQGAWVINEGLYNKIGSDRNGGTNFKGIIDEVRVSQSIRNAAWLKATYNSLWDSLLTYGSEETAEVTTNVMFIFSNF